MEGRKEGRKEGRTKPEGKQQKKKKTNAQKQNSHHCNRPDRNRTATPTVNKQKRKKTNAQKCTKTVQPPLQQTRQKQDCHPYSTVPVSNSDLCCVHVMSLEC